MIGKEERALSPFAALPPRIEFASHLFKEEMVLRTEVEELACAPSRFELRVADPQGALWAKSRDLVGTVIKIRVDDGAPFEGIVYGLRFVRDAQTRAGAAIDLWGFDTSYQLNLMARFRAHPKGSFKKTAMQIGRSAGLEVQVKPDVAGRIAAEHNQLVQYNETDFAFLRRIAFLAGSDLWPYRGKLYIGDGPGARTTIALNLDDAEHGVASVALEENWCGDPLGHIFPVSGVPFQGAPELKKVPEAESLPRAVDRPAGEGDLLKKLGAKARVWPSGLATAAADQKTLAREAAAWTRARRLRGAIILAGACPRSARPGCKLTLMSGKNRLAESVPVMGIQHLQEGGVPHCVLQLGRAGDFEERQPDTMLARHLWPAKITDRGAYDARVGSVEVEPLGWDAESKPLLARILTGSAVAKGGWLHAPVPGELVLLGFEGGNPDAPVVLGALFDSASADAAPALEPREDIFVLREPKKNGTLRIKLDNGKLMVHLDKIEFEMETDQKVALAAKDLIAMKAAKIEMKKGS